MSLPSLIWTPLHSFLSYHLIIFRICVALQRSLLLRAFTIFLSFDELWFKFFNPLSFIRCSICLFEPKLLPYVSNSCLNPVLRDRYFYYCMLPEKKFHLPYYCILLRKGFILLQIDAGYNFYISSMKLIQATLW